MTSEPTRQAAEMLRRFGLVAPARLLADAHLPLAPLAADLAAAAGPLVSAFAGGGLARLVERAADDEGTLEALIADLDAMEDRDAEPG